MNIKINKFPEHREHFYFAGYNTHCYPAVVFSVPTTKLKDFLNKIKNSLCEESHFLIDLRKESGSSITNLIVEYVNPIYYFGQGGFKEETDLTDIRLKVAYRGNDHPSSLNTFISNRCAEFIEKEWAEFNEKR